MCSECPQTVDREEGRIMGKSTEHTPSILKNKLFLYLTEFFAGMSVMAVELGASRLLAPYFSSSLDHYYRDDHDRNGPWKYLRGPECG